MMDLEIIILSEVSQTETNTFNITYMWNLKNNTNEFIYKIDSQTWKTNLWLPKGKADGGGISSVQFSRSVMSNSL